jgi:hypothetical protein
MVAQAVGFGFESIVLHDGDTTAVRVPDAAGTLLHNMGELVGEQLLPVRSMRVVVAGCEMDVGSPGEGDGADGSYLWAYMNAHIGKVGAQSRFHFGLDCLRQRPATGFRLHVHMKGLDTRMELPLKGRTRCT